MSEAARKGRNACSYKHPEVWKRANLQIAGESALVRISVHGIAPKCVVNRKSSTVLCDLSPGIAELLHGALRCAAHPGLTMT
jgi:hypothetical protein